MKFPIKGETVTRTYTCPTETHRFVGLRINDLGNKDIFPYIPCCFAKDQIQKPGSVYRKYYFNENESRKTQRHQETYTLRQILDPGDTGMLPDNLIKLFSIIERDPTSVYARKGITQTGYSCVEAILLGQGKIRYETMTRSAVSRVVKPIVVSLVDEKFALAAKQELYDHTVDSIMTLLKNRKLQASHFARVLETALDCNVFVFESTVDNFAGTLVIPRHAKSFYKFRPSRETFFLFQHYGTDAIDTPQTELIVKKSQGAETLGFFPGERIVKGIYKLFRRQTLTFVNGKKLPAVQIPRFPIQSQHIDLYGKCRIINVSHESSVLTIATSPMPPFAAPEITTTQRVSMATIESFSKRFGLKILWQRVVGNATREVGIYFGMEGVILAIGTETAENVPIRHDREEYDYIATIDRKRNLVEDYNSTKRTAALLYEYALWRLALFLNRKNVTVSTVDSAITSFVQNRVTIDETHVYDLSLAVNDSFSPNSTFIVDDKLVVTSMKTCKRLMFACRLMALNSPSQLASYASKINIPNYYQSILDFKDSPSNFILNGPEAVRNLLKTRGTTNELRYKIKFPSATAYYFQNAILSREYGKDSIYLAQPSATAEYANATAFAWDRLGYNIANDQSLLDSEMAEKKRETVAIYSYVNETEITKLVSASVPSDSIILAFKVEDVPHYVALLKIN